MFPLKTFPAFRRWPTRATLSPEDSAMPARSLRLALFIWLLALTVFAHAADQASAPEPATTSCSLEDDQQISVRYLPIASNSEKLSNGKPWAPGGTPMLLFTTATFTLNNTPIPAGAFSLYVIPGNDHWTLVVNKNVTAGSKYDEHQDLARGPMEVGQISGGVPKLDVAFGRMGAKVCSLRIYFGKVGASGDFKEQ